MPDTECSIIISSFYNAKEEGSEEAMMWGHQFRWNKGPLVYLLTCSCFPKRILRENNLANQQNSSQNANQHRNYITRSPKNHLTYPILMRKIILRQLLVRLAKVTHMEWGYCEWARRGVNLKTDLESTCLRVVSILCLLVSNWNALSGPGIRNSSIYQFLF